MRGIAANAFTLIIVIGVVIAGVVGYGQRMYVAPGPAGEASLFFVPRGATLDRVARDLEEAGLISSAALFRIGARYEGDAGRIRFGEYRIPARASMAETLDMFVRGDVVRHSITVAEGLSSHEIVELLKASDILTGEIEETPPEGSLAPDTYSVQRGDDRSGLIARMRALQQEILAEAWAARSDDAQVSTPQEALILASIIEKETGVAGERDVVSSVFNNRLERGMRLQSDPTIIYGITEGRGSLGRGIRRSEINAPTPWNTYVIDSLPPTPIANPGRDAIFAAVRPADTDYVYFVADGTGGHAFARTLAEHNRNVAAWRAIERGGD